MTRSTSMRNAKRPGRGAGIGRRDEFRRTRPPADRRSFAAWRDRPEILLALAVAVLYVLGASTFIIWSRGQAMVAENQIMRDTFAARVYFEVFDESGTRARRELAMQQAPRVYVEIEKTTSPLRQAILGLPKAVAGRATPAEVNETLVRAFNLTPETLAALHAFTDAQGEPTAEWTALVEQFFARGLYRRPIIDSDRWQLEPVLTPAPIRLRLADGTTRTVNVADLVDAEGDWPEALLAEVAGGFPRPIQPAIVHRLRLERRPMFQFDEAATQQSAQTAAQAVADQVIPHKQGAVLYTRGNRLTAEQVQLVHAEYDAYRKALRPPARWTGRIGVAGLVSLLAGALAAYLSIFHAPALSRPRHLLTLSLMSVGALMLSALATRAMPQALILAIIAPTLLLTVIVHVAYGRSMAVGVSAFHALLICLALDLRISALILLVVGSCAIVATLLDIRDRHTLVRAGVMTGAVVGVGAILRSIWTLPMVEPSPYWQAALHDGLFGASAGILVGVFALGVLSTVERLFDVTTGLTLVELRDPKHPLLRELHQRAPGTWNHSWQVATIAETAAEAIGANSLLTYVGALYHDIGKMNKPQYFVENQADGLNRHEKLSPAMSLLLIVGHVKDGLEMAREWGLPKPLHHFIEAHHGTTLVEYFYQVAKERAEAGRTNEDVNEVTYRYPGPRPRSREVAIIMLADAAESSSRTLADFSPTRIEQLVRNLGQKRLLDHQFDECNLTLRELTMIEDSIIKSLCAIRHARIVYPAEREREAPERETPTPPAAQTA
ncbi:MAG: HDIG domain-containing protein [Phycisphaerales bacterium]|nr:HDIG domain-containing protein [Phycisphaerales bacterium]